MGDFQIIEKKRAEDRKRLAGEQFGRSKNNVSNDVQICTLVDKEKHVEHVPQPGIDSGKSL